METGKNFNKTVPHCPRVYKPKQYPHTEKPGNMYFFLNILPLVVLSSCPSQQAVT